MTKMNPVHQGFPSPLDGTIRRNSLRTLVLAALGVAAVVVGGVIYYSTSAPPATVSKSVQGIEQSAPPATTGLGGAIIMPTKEPEKKGD